MPQKRNLIMQSKMIIIKILLLSRMDINYIVFLFGIYQLFSIFRIFFKINIWLKVNGIMTKFIASIYWRHTQVGDLSNAANLIILIGAVIVAIKTIYGFFKKPVEIVQENAR